MATRHNPVIKAFYEGLLTQGKQKSGLNHLYAKTIGHLEYACEKRSALATSSPPPRAGGSKPPLQAKYHDVLCPLVAADNDAILAALTTRLAKQQQRQAYWQQVRDVAVDDLVFLDETGVDLAMVPTYARTQRG